MMGPAAYRQGWRDQCAAIRTLPPRYPAGSSSHLQWQHGVHDCLVNMINATSWEPDHEWEKQPGISPRLQGIAMAAWSGATVGSILAAVFVWIFAC